MRVSTIAYTCHLIKMRSQRYCVENTQLLHVQSKTTSQTSNAYRYRYRYRYKQYQDLMSVTFSFNFARRTVDKI